MYSRHPITVPTDSLHTCSNVLRRLWTVTVYWTLGYVIAELSSTLNANFELHCPTFLRRRSHREFVIPSTVCYSYSVSSTTPSSSSPHYIKYIVEPIADPTPVGRPQQSLKQSRPVNYCVSKVGAHTPLPILNFTNSQKMKFPMQCS